MMVSYWTLPGSHRGGLTRPRSARRCSVLMSGADVLVPEVRPGADELLHQADTLGVVAVIEDHAPRVQIRLRAAEGPALADDDPGDLVQQGRARAHVAGGEGRVQDGSPVVARPQ